VSVWSVQDQECASVGLTDDLLHCVVILRFLLGLRVVIVIYMSCLKYVLRSI
jgi:hypothetical protein